MTVNAPVRPPLRGPRPRARVRYLGWAVPEAVYVDFDVIACAPPTLNRSGIGDILCYHTAHFDWKLADASSAGPRRRWPYDERSSHGAASVSTSVLDAPRRDPRRSPRRGSGP